METENNMKNEMEMNEFVGDFECFYKAMNARAGKIENEHVVTLYAIYRKNKRAEKMNGNGNGYSNYGNKPKQDQPATDKQVRAIESMARKGRIPTTDTKNLTKREASKILDIAFGKGEKSPFSSISPSPTIPKLYETENIPVENKIIWQKWEIKDINFYWLIAEYDEKQELAFGYANLNNDDFAEWGYISIKELKENGAEIDKEWKPTKFKEVMRLLKQEALGR